MWNWLIDSIVHTRNMENFAAMCWIWRWERPINFVPHPSHCALINTLKLVYLQCSSHSYTQAHTRSTFIHQHPILYAKCGSPFVCKKGRYRQLWFSAYTEYTKPTHSIVGTAWTRDGARSKHFKRQFIVDWIICFGVWWNVFEHLISIKCGMWFEL